MHPDKGGSTAGFTALQAAFETLSDVNRRAVYDALAADVRRPATKECWTCTMAICDFCTRRQHWKGGVPLHWPLVNAPNRLTEQLGKQELEVKRKEDGLAYKMRQPGYRCREILASASPGGTSTPPLLDIEATSSSLRVQHKGFAPVLYRAWSKPVKVTGGVTSWVSTTGQLLALVVPKAFEGDVWSSCFKGDSYASRCLCSPYSLLQLPHEVQLEMPLPYWVEPAEDIQVSIGRSTLQVSVDGWLALKRTFWRNQEQSMRLLDAHKEQHGRHSHEKVFLPCVANPPAANMSPVPDANGGPHSFAPTVSALKTSTAVNPGHSVKRPAASMLLGVTLALPEPTAEDVMYKKGIRQNNAAAVRSCLHGSGKTGAAFFIEDEDEFGLQALLQALQFAEVGHAWVCPNPWEVAAGSCGLRSPAVASAGSSAGEAGGASSVCGRWVADEAALPAGAQQHLKWLREAAAGTDKQLPQDAVADQAVSSMDSTRGS
eukprot:gene11937-12080_t